MLSVGHIALTSDTCVIQCTTKCRLIPIRKQYKASKKSRWIHAYCENSWTMCIVNLMDVAFQMVVSFKRDRHRHPIILSAVIMKYSLGKKTLKLLFHVNRHVLPKCSSFLIRFHFVCDVSFVWFFVQAVNSMLHTIFHFEDAQSLFSLRPSSTLMT